MLYYLCPRCQFKVPANKHVCTTCGYKIPATNSGNASLETEGKQARTNVWLKMLGLDTGAKKEQGHEKPALAE